MHLVGNIIGFQFSGIFLERIINRYVYLAAYFTTGICASVVSIVFHESVVSVGASGAIFGLFGMLLAMLISKDRRVSLFRAPLLTSIAIYAGLNLFLGIITPGIDLAAHVGGFAAGLIVGVIVLKSPASLKVIQPLQKAHRLTSG